MAPKIDDVREIGLNDLEKQILRNLFVDYQDLIINNEFSGGFGGARVLQVTPSRGGATDSTLPLVAKLGPKPTIEREWTAFSSILSGTLPNMMGVWAEPVYIGDQGGLCIYLHGSGTFEGVSLLEYLQTNSEKDAQFTLRRLMDVLERMVRHHRVRGNYDMRLCFDSIVTLNL